MALEAEAELKIRAYGNFIVKVVVFWGVLSTAISP
jgi:hypothetical protein